MHRSTDFVVRIALGLLFLLPGFQGNAQENPTSMETRNNSIREEQFIVLNGIEQWVTIQGDRSKPLILFLHGGPGSPLSPYSDALYRNWEKDFMIVQWDQRGAGRTYGYHAPEELTPAYIQANPLTVEQMTSDGIALAEYLIKNLGKSKIILFGTSWGSVLGVRMASERPDLFYAYVGHSQVVEPASDVELYKKVYKMAKRSKDTKTLDVLCAIGKPPYNRASHIGGLLKVVKKYERAHSTPAPAAWFDLPPAYNNPQDKQHQSDGDDYSFVQYVGDSTWGIRPIRAGIHFLKDQLEFKIPVYLIQGAEDLLTPEKTSRKYFRKIKAPQKEYMVLPKTAHGFNEAVLEAQYLLFKRIKTS